jgi:hypothetical protein
MRRLLFATSSSTLRSTFAIAGLLSIASAQAAPPVVVRVSRPAPRFDVSDTLVALSQHVRNTPVADHTVASASWLLLAFQENGSTMKAGPHRVEVRHLVATLLELQRPLSGQFARNGVASSPSDQIAGALALLVAFERSQHRPLQRPALLGGCAALDRGTWEAALAAKSDAAASTNEEVALLTLLLPTLSRLTAGAPELADQLTGMAGDLVAARKFGKTRRGDAALHLGQLMLGEPHAPELTVARTWPASMTADPLHTVFAILAVSTDEKSLARQSRQIEDLLAARVKDGSSAGMWPAAAGFDEITTTAMLAFAIGVANGSPLLVKPK